MPASQPVEKPAPAIKPEQVFCLETKAETEKASKQQLHFSPILFVFRHPAPDGGKRTGWGKSVAAVLMLFPFPLSFPSKKPALA